MAHKPENTLSSFRKAVELGADMVELDVHLSKDNQAVVIHDSCINRMTDGEGKVNDLTLEEIKKFKVRGNEKIPSLQEVVDLVKDKCRLNIEIKDEKALEESVRIIKKNKIEDKVVISSFIEGVVKKSKKLDPGIKTALLFVAAESYHLELANYLNVDYVNIHQEKIKKVILDKARNLNLKINAWGADNKSSIRRMIKLGVDGIITNDPGLIK